MEHETVSIAVAIYKVENYLRKCIESITCQTYGNIEIILVDDGSPDSCPEICEEYSKKDKRIKVIHKENGGLVSARKVGVLEASGKYMMLMDGDDWIDEKWIENLMSSVRHDTDLVVGRYALSYNDKEVPVQTSLPSGFYTGDDLILIKNKMIFDTERYTYGVISPSVWNKLFIRDRLIELYRNIPNDLTLGEDMAITMPYVKDVESISVVDTPIFYRYVQRSDSMVRSYDNRLVNNISTLKKYLDSIHWSDCEKEQLNYYYSKLLLYSVKNQLKSKKDLKGELECIYRIPDIENVLRNISYRRIPTKQRIVILAFRYKMYGLLKMISHFI